MEQGKKPIDETQTEQDLTKEDVNDIFANIFSKVRNKNSV